MASWNPKVIQLNALHWQSQKNLSGRDSAFARRRIAGRSRTESVLQGVSWTRGLVSSRERENVDHDSSRSIGFTTSYWLINSRVTAVKWLMDIGKGPRCCWWREVQITGCWKDVQLGKLFNTFCTSVTNTTAWTTYLDDSTSSEGYFHSGHQLACLRLVNEVMIFQDRLRQETTSSTDWHRLHIFVYRARTPRSWRRQPSACQNCALPVTEWRESVCRDAARCALAQRQVLRWREMMSSSSTTECAFFNCDCRRFLIFSKCQHGSFSSVLGCAIAWRADLARSGNSTH